MIHSFYLVKFLAVWSVVLLVGESIADKRYTDHTPGWQSIHMLPCQLRPLETPIYLYRYYLQSIIVVKEFKYYSTQLKRTKGSYSLKTSTHRKEGADCSLQSGPIP